MSLAELAPSLHALPRSEKLMALQLISADLSSNEMMPLAPAGEYAIYTPQAPLEAEDTLLQLLAQETAS